MEPDVKNEAKHIIEKAMKKKRADELN